jgi:hypothetical protein
MPLTTLCSIVFIHGLQGHPRNTWTWESDASLPEYSVPIENKSKQNKWKWKSLKKLNKTAADVLKATNPARAAVFWPYHLLPADCPTSRILTWGYDSNIVKFFDAVSKNNILQYALNLEEDLIAQRRLSVRRWPHCRCFQQD